MKKTHLFFTFIFDAKGIDIMANYYSAQDLHNAWGYSKRGYDMKQVENGTCDNHAHRKAVAVHIGHEEGFTEYSGVCQECYNKSLKGAYKAFAAMVEGTNTDTFYCERCKTYHPRYSVNGTEVSDDLRIHRDVEDRSTTDCCPGCYAAMVKADNDYWAEDIRLDEEPPFEEDDEDLGLNNDQFNSTPKGIDLSRPPILDTGSSSKVQVWPFHNYK